MTGNALDEGYNDDEVMISPLQTTFGSLAGTSKDATFVPKMSSVKDTEELAYQLLATLPRSRLAMVQRRLAPLLQFDVVGSLPDEVSLQIFSNLSYETLLLCGLVSRRWQALSNDQTLWKILCHKRGWSWRQPPRIHPFEGSFELDGLADESDDDEGMGDSDAEENDLPTQESTLMVVDETAPLSMLDAGHDSGFISTSFASSSSAPMITSPTPSPSRSKAPIRLRPLVSSTSREHVRHSAPSILGSTSSSSTVRPNYKLLYQTHVKLLNRFHTNYYQLLALQTRGAPSNSHSNTIYCLQLYTYPATGEQVLFTGSRDKTIREWDLRTGLVKRVFSGAHTSSVLSLCVHNGLLASGGSDHKVVVWDLETDKLVKVLMDHEDSVLCVRFDDERLVSCSKDRTVRVYNLPNFEYKATLSAHRAAVNAVSITPTLIASASGDRSVRLWDAKTGSLLRTFENHHTRGIASVDFKPPYILSGSSDKHLRVSDISSAQLQGWSTSLEHEHENSNSGGLGGASSSYTQQDPPLPLQIMVCSACGSPNMPPQPPSPSSAGPSHDTASRRARSNRRVCAQHGDLVRSVALGDEFVVSGSYDMSVKVWDRKTGALVADLTGGHTGRVFCVGFDCTKIVSCGEDQRICIWDFSHGIDTSFIEL